MYTYIYIHILQSWPVVCVWRRGSRGLVDKLLVSKLKGGELDLPNWAQVFLKLACLSEEARKAVGPFYLRGKVKDHIRGRCVTRRGLSHYSITKTLLILSRALD